MDRGRIFLVGDDAARLIPMHETPYAREDILQELLERYPDLLPGDQINPEDPRRWLLIAREMGVPGAPLAGDRWSLDHLLLDQDGIPTFVECKRATDIRIRREVVAQMLEYAANGTAYWPADRLRLAAMETIRKRLPPTATDEEVDQALTEAIRDLLGGEATMDMAAFWNRVDDHVRTGRVRLIFVADHIPAELRRLVEFLNEKMESIEVLAVVLKQFQGPDQRRVIVPQLIGATEAARERKPPPTPQKTSLARFLATCPTPDVADVFKQVIILAEQRGYTVYWGRVGFSVRIAIGGKLTTLLYGWPPGAVASNAPHMLQWVLSYLNLDPAGQEALKAELRAMGIFSTFTSGTVGALVTPASAAQVSAQLTVIFTLIERLEHTSARLPEP